MIKIKKIKFFDHYLFKNQEFDFTIDGIAVNNIIIAGENGSGKTKLLEELNNIKNQSFFPGNSAYSHKVYEITLDISDEGYYSVDDENIKFTEAILTRARNDNLNFSNTILFINDGKSYIQVKKDGNVDRINEFRLNSLFSTVDINYKPRRNVEGITDKKLDEEYPNIPEDMAYEIIQLLVDIAVQDNNELDSWYALHKSGRHPEEIYHRNLKRFTNAFKLMFGDSIIFKGIKDNTTPIFIKDGNEVDISSLSSGEKQIIFRGVFLLRNKISLEGCPVFIDEPEISMHPIWENRIFDYYRTLFCNEEEQTSQLFVATHSEHILSNVLDRDDCIVIKLKDHSCEKFYKDSPGTILPKITIAEIKYSIFDLLTTDLHILLYGYIQSNLVKDGNGNQIVDPTIKETDEWLKTQGVTLKNYSAIVRGRQLSYDTLQTYIRNCIDHPDDTITYSETDFETSINEMINIIKTIH